jgi:hypothetical protein
MDRSFTAGTCMTLGRNHVCIELVQRCSPRLILLT